MSTDHEKLGIYRQKRGGLEWMAYRNSDGCIELYRTTGENDDGTKKGIERIVALARTFDEVDEYFVKQKKAKYNPHQPNQLKIG